MSIISFTKMLRQAGYLENWRTARKIEVPRSHTLESQPTVLYFPLNPPLGVSSSRRDKVWGKAFASAKSLSIPYKGSLSKKKIEMFFNTTIYIFSILSKVQTKASIKKFAIFIGLQHTI